ncbi:MAG: Gfo/Idh/MocA family protein [Blastocatellia bacterium]
MSNSITRRQFVASSIVSGASLTMATGSSLRAQSASDKVVIAVAGVRMGEPGFSGRGPELIQKFAGVPGVEIRYVVDVDSRSLGPAAAFTEKKTGRLPKTETDFRRVLDDKDVNALLIATPDHWHAPMAILAAKAGKDVYLEKPCSHNPREGEMVVAAAAKYKRVIQMGNQRRSIGNVQQMIQELQGGVIGKVFLANCFYARRRQPIGFGKKIAPPSELNWDLWQGPAPRMAYRDNLHPYNWHWFWNWGTGEALNNGTHLLDVARWGLNVRLPKRVNSMGGRWHDVGLDDWECPDTQEIQLEFEGGQGITWFGRSTSTYGAPGYKSNGIIFLGSKGTIDYDGSVSYTVYDLNNKPVKKVTSERRTDLANSGDPGLGDNHADNFIDTIRGKAKLNAPIAEGHISTLLAQLGNISHRVGRSLNTNPANGHIIGDSEAMKLWSREYEKGWEPKV